MKDFLAHLFMPRESNNHRAKVLHHANLFLTVLFLFLASIFIQQIKGAFPSVLGVKVDMSAEELLSLTNKERQIAGVGNLILDEKLSQAAAKKAEDMFEYNYWAHNSPTGKTPWIFIKNAGYKYIYAGENLARGFSTAEDVVKAWMASPDHKNNMLSSNYQDVGFAVKVGRLNGEETVLIVEQLGNLNTPIAKSKTQEIATARNADTSVRSAEVRKNPIINVSSLSSNVYVTVVLVFIFALILDMIIIEKKKVMRFVGHNIDHVLYLFLILVLVTIWTKGVIV